MSYAPAVTGDAKPMAVAEPIVVDDHGYVIAITEDGKIRAITRDALTLTPQAPRDWWVAAIGEARLWIEEERRRVTEESLRPKRPNPTGRY